MTDAFKTPLPNSEMVYFTFVVGAGKLARQKYDDKLPQYVRKALNGIGFTEDSGSSCLLACQGTFKYQHDTNLNLKRVHVFPHVTPPADGGEVA